MHLAQLLAITGGALLLGACAETRPVATPAPRGFWHTNRFDRNGLEHGRWRTYYDSANTKRYTAGRYRHGRPVGHYRYYAPTGMLDHSERYRRAGYCEVTYWYPDGRVARRGPAQLVSGAQGARFYWFGPWMSYAENGQLTGIQTYTDGSLTRAETYKNGQLTQVETYKNNQRTSTETYDNGKIIKVETFENGRRTGSTLPL